MNSVNKGQKIQFGNKKLSQSKLFLTALIIPLFTAIIAGLIIFFSDDYSVLISQFWEKYKIPMAIGSLSIPLVAWVVANHRSEQTMVSLSLQSNKRLYDMYYEQQAHFEKVIGRKIKTANFKYIQVEDLPVIFSELYQFNNLHTKGSVTLNPKAIEHIKLFFRSIEKVVIGFYDIYQDEKENKVSRSSVEAGYINQLFINFSNVLYELSNKLGVRFIELEDSSVEIFKHAYIEVRSLAYFMGDDFKDAYYDLKDEYGESVFDNTMDFFDAIDVILTKDINISGKNSYKNFMMSLQVTGILKTMNSTSLQLSVTDFFNKLKDILTSECDVKDFVLIDGKYLELHFIYLDEIPLVKLSFHETSTTKGIVTLLSENGECSTSFEFKDKEKVCVFDEIFITNLITLVSKVQTKFM